MARLPDADVQRLKTEISLLHLVEVYTPLQYRDYLPLTKCTAMELTE